MKRAALAVLFLSVLGASAAMADSRHGRDGWHDDRGRHERNHDRDDRHGRNDRHDRRDWDRDRHNYRDNDRRYHHGYDRHHDYRHRQWRRGDRLPRAYYSRPYVIANYGHHHLRRPPRGCHYVRVNNDVVLAAIATGVILDVLYNHF
jgi:Ni/Co efflux regulator RcnB